MSVTLNEAALHFMLEARAGPVGLMLERTVNVIAGNEEAIVNLIFANPIIRPRIHDDVFTGDEGLTGVVGVVPYGKVEDYFIAKLDREDWLVPAIMQNWDSQI